MYPLIFFALSAVLDDLKPSYLNLSIQIFSQTPQPEIGDTDYDHDHDDKIQSNTMAMYACYFVVFLKGGVYRICCSVVLFVCLFV